MALAELPAADDGGERPWLSTSEDGEESSADSSEIEDALMGGRQGKRSC